MRSASGTQRDAGDQAGLQVPHGYSPSEYGGASGRTAAWETTGPPDSEAPSLEDMTMGPSEWTMGTQ